MEEIISDIGSTPALEPVTEDNIMDLINSARATTDTQPDQPLENSQDQQDVEDFANSNLESAPPKSEIISDIGSTSTLEPVTEDNIMDLIDSVHAAPDTQPELQQAPFETSQEHQGEVEESNNASTTPAKEHTCGFCGIVFKSYPALVEHRATHGGSRPYECHVCNKRFTQKAHLIIHRRTHTGEKPYACHICQKRFSQTSHLNSHKRVHTGEKPFFCSICNMGFCRRQRLEVHLQQHTKDMQGIATRKDSQRQVKDKQLDKHTRQGLALEDIHQGLSLEDMQQGLTLEDMQQGLTSHNSGSADDPGLGLVGMADAKSLLMSMGLRGIGGTSNKNRKGQGGTQDGSAIRSTDSGNNPGSSVNKVGVASQMAVFPGFDVGGEMENEEDAAEDGGIEERNSIDADSDHRTSRSPTPSSSNSQNSTLTSTPKSRRKPAFVRKIGMGQPVKSEECKDDSENTKQSNANDLLVDASKAQQMSAQEAAVRAMIRMATGSDRSDINDVSDLDVSLLLKQSFLGAGNGGGMSTSHQSSTQAFPKFSPETPGARSVSSSLHQPLSHIPSQNSKVASLIRTNTRVSLVDFTAEDLLRHLMSRDDIYRCDFCCIIFNDAAMYHLHRSMHDKMDIRCCNLCGKLLSDKYDFTAHFLSQHK